MAYLIIELFPFLCLAFAIGLVVGWFACVYGE